MLKKLLLGGCVAALIPPAAGWLASEQLAHPPRRPLQDFHTEFLADPAAHQAAGERSSTPPQLVQVVMFIWNSALQRGQTGSLEADGGSYSVAAMFSRRKKACSASASTESASFCDQPGV
jgi:hypothetical protein